MICPVVGTEVGGRGVTADEYEVSFGGGENVLKLDLPC